MTLYERLRKALHEDNSITCVESELAHKAGYTTEYLESLGLKQSDLKKLERKGLAIRGYTQNAWVDVNNKITHVGRGSKVRWLIVDKGAQDERTKE